MKALATQLWNLKIWRDTRGQDFVEYTLIGGFIVSIYTAITPTVAPLVATVLNHVTGALKAAGG